MPDVVLKTPSLTKLKSFSPRMFKRWAEIYSAFIQARFDSASRGDGTWKPLALSTIMARRRGYKAKQALKQRTINLSPAHQRLQRSVYRKALKVLRAKGVEDKKAKQLAYNHSLATLRAAGGRVATVKEVMKGLAAVPGMYAILKDTGLLRNCLVIGEAGNIDEVHGNTLTFGIGGGLTHPEGGPTIGAIARYHQDGGAIPGRPPQRKILVIPPTEIIKDMVDASHTLLRD